VVQVGDGDEEAIALARGKRLQAAQRSGEGGAVASIEDLEQVAAARAECGDDIVGAVAVEIPHSDADAAGKGAVGGVEAELLLARHGVVDLDKRLAAGIGTDDEDARALRGCGRLGAEQGFRGSG
jgi:hypothetical protein